MPPPQYPSLDDLILSAPHRALLVPMCAKEVLVLRMLGTRWQGLTAQVVQAHSELMAHPEGFGAVDFKLFATRKYMEGNVMKTLGQSIDIPQEFFTWPLSK